MKPSLKHSVNELLESVQLDDARLRNLERMQQTHRSRPWWQHPALPVAAAACIIAALLVALLPWLSPQRVDDPVLAIAEEVALQHIKHEPLEVRGNSITAVEGYFEDLGFALIDPLGDLPDAELVGGRYCSVKGIKAVQLRRQDANGQTQTLYQVPYDAGSFGALPDVGDGEAPRRLLARGLVVDLWVERGLLMALTRTP
jgi:hypothetical protein